MELKLHTFLVLFVKDLQLEVMALFVVHFLLEGKLNCSESKFD